MSSRHLAAAVLAVVFAVGCSEPETESVAHSDSGVRGPAYDKILDELRSLEAQYPGVAKLIPYGTSVNGQQLAMIRIGRVGAGAGSAKRPALWISGTIHGDEYLGVEDRAPRWLLESQQSDKNGGAAKFLASGGVIYVAPILNPDGYEARRRENVRGQDLNRDFALKRISKAGFTQPETRGLGTTLKSELATNNLDLQLTLDYHCCVGALIYPWGHSATAKLEPPVLAEHRRMAALMLRSFPGYNSGQAINVVNYVAVGASDDYFHETYGARSFTFEGAYAREARQFDKHTEMWDHLLSDRAGAPIQPDPAPGGAGDLTLAIAGDDGSAVSLGAAAKAADKMSLCRGSAVACLGASPDIVSRFGAPQRVGERMIFVSEGRISIADGETYTILAQSSAGAVMGSQAVRFSKTR